MFSFFTKTSANYNNLADWIGATVRGRFNFPLFNRQIQLDINILGIFIFKL